ncbi:uncharacterized protein LOC143898154 isoform X3 [Temnothorax americanus]|uniref:uncharacterized protein LOC143898154 isoform X3 n=1 Tax=Temnothorax americanus TaxID=1964332 RepID=UPI0040693AB6
MRISWILLQFREEIAGSSVHKLGQQSNERVNSHADGSSCRTETESCRFTVIPPIKMDAHADQTIRG